MPFRRVGAIQASHRIGACIQKAVWCALRVPVLRYGVDFFGAGRRDITHSGGKLVELVMTFLGLRADLQKSLDDAMRMAVLGCPTSADFLRRSRSSAKAWG